MHVSADKTLALGAGQAMCDGKAGGALPIFSWSISVTRSLSAAPRLSAQDLCSPTLSASLPIYVSSQVRASTHRIHSRRQPLRRSLLLACYPRLWPKVVPWFVRQRSPRLQETVLPTFRRQRGVQSLRSSLEQVLPTFRLQAAAGDPMASVPTTTLTALSASAGSCILQRYDLRP